MTAVTTDGSTADLPAVSIAIAVAIAVLAACPCMARHDLYPLRAKGVEKKAQKNHLTWRWFLRRKMVTIIRQHNPFYI